MTLSILSLANQKSYIKIRPQASSYDNTRKPPSPDCVGEEFLKNKAS